MRRDRAAQGRVVPSARTTFTLERLEPRLLLSGNVAAVVSGGILTITGDNLDNQISIDQSGLDPDQFRVTALDSTWVNGTCDVVLSGVTRGMKISMEDGNDSVVLDSVAVPGNLKVDGGDGSNSLVIDPSIIYGSLTVKNGEGHDVFSLIDSTVNGKVKIDNGSGGSVTSLSGSEVWGKLSVKNKVGYDVFVLHPLF